MQEKRQVWIELFLLSAVSLYVELLVIRWMSADIRAFTVFRTFPLVTCFVGLGVGLALNRDDSFKLCLPAMLQFAVIMLVSQILHVGLWGFPSASVFQWQNLVYSGSHSGVTQWGHLLNYSQEQVLFLFAFMLMFILLLLGPFSVCLCIGARLGKLFNELPPLAAYSINLAGAIAGSVSFAFISFAGWAPWCMIIPPLAFILPMTMRRFGRSWVQVAMAVLVPVVCYLAPHDLPLPVYPSLVPYREAITTDWSPYQRIDLTTFAYKPADNKPKEFFGLELGANRAWYQGYFNPDLSGHTGSAALEDVLDDNKASRNLPYQLHGAPPNDVLIVGAGTGEDVAFAVRNGAKAVDAVEIDPVILNIGRKYNPDYKLAAVNLVCDDARHYFNHCSKKYDVIVFGHLDSQAVSGQGSSVRVDGYVYTKESIAKAMTLLKPDGIICLSFISAAPWTRARLFSTVEAAAGYPPLCTGGDQETNLIVGNGVKDGKVTLPANQKPSVIPKDANSRILTDDWPYLYVQNDVVDYPYLLVVLEILGLSIFAGKRLLFGKTQASSWQMFFLGAAFLLLELHSISHLSLLYGSTWITSAIVINCILVMLLVANMAVARLNKGLMKNLNLVYGLLFASLVVTFAVPTNSILDNAALGSFAYAIVTFLTLLPLGLAGIVFSTSFSQAEDPARALAFNLFGSVVGGLLEYLSNYVGVRGLVVVGGMLYLMSFICWINSVGRKPPLPAEEQAQNPS